MRSGLVACLLVAVVVLAGSPVAFAQPCEAGWVSGEFILPGLNGPVYAAAEFDDGRGPALYVGGDFTIAGGVVANHVARWDGERWEALGGGVNGRVHALAVYDDGDGEALYVGGWFDRVDGQIVRGFARWDGAAWSWPSDQLTSCTSVGCRVAVLSMAVYDDGRGEALYVGGDFTRAGGVGSLSQLFRYDGAWSRPGDAGVGGGEVFAMAVHDDGSGPALYIGGNFTSVATSVGPFIARLRGQEWSAVGEATRPVLALQAFELDGEPALFAGGDFVGASGEEIRVVGAWDGAQWRQPAQAFSVTSGPVSALAVHDAGIGPRLFAAGSFRFELMGDSQYLLALEGDRWEVALDDHRGPSVADIESMLSWDDAGGPVLLLGGVLNRTTGDRIAGLARWEGGLVEPFSPGMPGTVSAIAVSPAEGLVYISMGRPGAQRLGALHTVYAWDGNVLRALPGALDDDVLALAVLDVDGTPTLFAGGEFGSVDGVELGSVVRWDGSAWRSTGAGRVIAVQRLEIADLGDGPRLYALGRVSGIGGLATSGLARLAADGASWEALGSGANGRVLAVEVFDAGDGPMLYAGGEFRSIGGIATDFIARWDPTLEQWFDVGGGASGFVVDLAVYDDGGGPALYAGGRLQIARPGEPTSRNIGRWDGTEWSGIGEGVSGEPSNCFRGVYALHVFDDGTGERLFIGGCFFGPGAASEFGPNMIAWDGIQWSGIGSADDDVTRFEALAVDGERSLMAVGNFDVVGDRVVSIRVARYQGCDPCPADLDADGELTIFDFLAFQNLFDAGDPRADFDGDGELTIFDFLAFQNAFDAGC